jgi:GNAT superfamily N-acetyltransferase
MMEEIRTLEPGDVDPIAFAFATWPKPRQTFERYLVEQLEQRRVVLVAWCDGRVCGYVNVVWQPKYPPFRDHAIPEIQDLNVLPEFRRRGIGGRLVDAAERLASTRSAIVGIGVGLYAGYGSAQRMYARRGYVPDGRGATYRNENMRGGETVVVDDDLVLYLSKELDRIG